MVNLTNLLIFIFYISSGISKIGIYGLYGLELNKNDVKNKKLNETKRFHRLCFLQSILKN